MQGLVLGDLKVDADDSAPGRISLHLSGSSNSRDPSTGLRPFFSVMLAQAAAKSLSLELHFEKLSHFNSSTIATLLRFIEDARAKQVKLAIFYDGSLRWQAHNFQALGPLVRKDGMLTIQRIDSGAVPEKIGDE